MSTYIAAIDLGTTKVVAILGEKAENGRFRILAYDEAESSGIRRGQVENIQHVIEALKPTLENVKKKAGVTHLDEVFVGIAGQHIRCLENRSDLTRVNYEEEITEEEVRSLETSMFNIRMEPGEKVLHVIPQHYNVDDAMEVTDPVGRLGQRLSGNFHIIIGKTHSAKHTALCIERVGLKLRELVLEPLASARAVLTDDEREAGVVMVDMGGGTTDLVVYYENIVRHTAIIPFGGNIITDDIRKGCCILQRHAEKIKLKFGSCLPSQVELNKLVTVPGINGREPREISFKVLSEIIQARFSEIMDMVVAEIVRSGYADKMSAGIVFTGGGALMAHLPQFVKLKTGFDTRIGKPEYIAANSDSDILQPKFATAAGLIMCGFDIVEGKKSDYSNADGLLTRTLVPEFHVPAPVPTVAAITETNDQTTAAENTVDVPQKVKKSKNKFGFFEDFFTFFEETRDDRV